MKAKTRCIKSDEKAEQKELIEDFLLVGLELGKSPTKSEYKKAGIFDPKKGIKRFGSWENVISAVGCVGFNLYPSIELGKEMIKEIPDKFSLNRKMRKFNNTTIFNLTRPKAFNVYTIDKDKFIDREEAESQLQNYYENSHKEISNPQNYHHFRNMSSIYKKDSENYIYHFETFTKGLKELNIYDDDKSILQLSRANPETVNELLKICNLVYNEKYYQIRNNTGWSIQTAETLYNSLTIL